MSHPAIYVPHNLSRLHCSSTQVQGCYKCLFRPDITACTLLLH